MKVFYKGIKYQNWSDISYWPIFCWWVWGAVDVWVGWLFGFFFWEWTIYLFFFQTDCNLFFFLFSLKSYKEVLFLQHRIALSELCVLVPWLLHITVMFCEMKWVVFGGRCATSREISPSIRLDGNVRCLNSASKSSSMDCVNIFPFQRQEMKSQEREISCCYALSH